MSKSPTEAETRQHFIDDQLARAGWSLDQRNLIEEYLLDERCVESHDPYATFVTGNEYADYVLLGENGKPMAIVEAKRTSRDALAGQRQAADYADRIRSRCDSDPFIFLTNGHIIWFWDRPCYPLREISRFFTREDLERLLFQRSYRQLLSELGPNPSIAGRPYQVEAIKRITEAMERLQRKFLLVMATGTGKTRTTVAFIDLLMRAKWAQRVLFLADRRELVRQALGDFKEHMPHEARARIEGNEVNHNARIHVATYPSLMQVYRQLSAGYYDLIVADESHRSIYNRYRELFDHFDAMQLGLTATPTDYIDHNTFDLFECPDGLPTFYYSYETAVEEGYLVNYRALEAQTSFQLQGIKAGQLPPEFQRQIEDLGIDLGEIDFEGTELEHRVTNTGTNDAIVHEFMAACRKDAAGSLPGKTIIFAMSHRHAVELWKSFNRLYPDLQRRGFAQVIDSHMERADKSLDDFKRKEMPRIAISVDMLDTGIDVPAIRNLVFAKPVFSQVKFWQMIGRGTRLWTDPESGDNKTDFLIIDYWNNFAYFNMSPEGEVAKPTEAITVRLFRLRIEKLLLLEGLHETDAASYAVGQLTLTLSHLPNDNVNVRPHLDEINQLAQTDAWRNLDSARVDHLVRSIAPLLRFLSEVNLAVARFEVRTEKLAVAHLLSHSDEIRKLKDQIIDDLRLLPTELREVQSEAEKLALVTSVGFWEHLCYSRIMDMQETFAPLMRYRQKQNREIIVLTLPDQIASRRWIIYGPSGEGAFAETYREQVETHVRSLVDQLPALKKLRQGEPLTEADLESLANGLSRPDLFITEDVLRNVYERPDADLLSFLRHILGSDHLQSREEQIRKEFDEFIAAHSGFTATQINFLRTVRTAVLAGARLTSEVLEQPPFSRVAAVKNLFSEAEVGEILELANRLVA